MTEVIDAAISVVLGLCVAFMAGYVGHGVWQLIREEWNPREDI